MPEGLSPLEAHKELQEHGHRAVPVGGRRGQVVQVAEALLLALVTITVAWSGFAAAKWGTESRLDLAAASSTRTEANRALYTEQNLRNFDASTFNAWFTAFTLDNPEKMAIAEKRFRPEFKVAFDAWRATDPDTNPTAPPGPASMPQYHIAEADQAAELDKAADEHTAAGEDAGSVSDQYIRITVALAGVLFLVGIGSTFSILNVRYALLGVGGVLLIASIVLILRQPGPPT
ncbi:UNVERIFIED_CONTAM: hypothetical protein DES50_101637 [Williamsia faeni]